MKLEKIIKSVIAFFGILFLGMRGGQKNKAVRRLGVPALAVLFGIIYDGFQWRDLSLILLIPLLSIGYGENSHLMGLIGNDTLVRIAYGAILSIPFVAYGVKRWFVACIALILAFSAIAGSLGNVSWFGDILIEDIIRYGTLGVLVVYNVIFSKKTK